MSARSFSGVAWPRLRHAICTGVFCLAALAPFLQFTAAHAAQSAARGADRVIVIRNDRGGLVAKRAEQIRQIRRSGQRVEIRGTLCLSSCTMYLGLPGTCVSPNTTFGFHGPSRSGRRLSPDEFEYWSALIARHYPAALRDWYMETGRMRITSYYRMSGRELIRLGVPACT
ncbi:hypothetical protein [Aliiroseovarius sp.]|uniref:hypothetical protein n=1 Tax=Aliiroseovarius sp. TaxID=1872442 RepID=UPI003BABEE46